MIRIHSLFDAVNRRLDEWVQVGAMDLNTVETENDDNKDDKVRIGVS